MSAASSSLATPARRGDVGSCGIAAAAVIFAGTLLCYNTSGYLVPGADTAKYRFAGVSRNDYDNTSGSNGTLTGEFYRDGVYKFASSGLARTDVGKPVYLVDDSTVGLLDDSSVDNDVLVGVIEEYVSATQVWVRIIVGDGTRTVVVNDTPLRLGGLLGVSVAASTAITGETETQASFSTTVTIPANTLKAGSRVKIRAQGIHTAATGSETHTLLLLLGSTTLVSKASIDPAANDVFVVDFELVVRTAGGSGTMVGAGSLGLGASGSGSMYPVYLASTAIDTTAAQIVAVAIDRQASATDGDSARLDILSVEITG